jgi:hypothetical protein
MNDQDGKHGRGRYTVAGALVALVALAAIAAVGATAGTNPPAPKPPVRVTGPAPSVPQPLQNAVQQIVNNGTITAAQGRTLDGDIRAGTVHPDQLASQGFTQGQVEAVQQMLRSTKLQLAGGANGSTSTPTVRRRHSHPKHHFHPINRRS